jgi:hypothetical protein
VFWFRVVAGLSSRRARARPRPCPPAGHTDRVTNLSPGPMRDEQPRILLPPPLNLCFPSVGPDPLLLMKRRRNELEVVNGRLAVSLQVRYGVFVTEFAGLLKLCIDRCEYLALQTLLRSTCLLRPTSPRKMRPIRLR